MSKKSKSVSAGFTMKHLRAVARKEVGVAENTGKTRTYTRIVETVVCDADNNPIGTEVKTETYTRPIYKRYLRMPLKRWARSNLWALTDGEKRHGPASSKVKAIFAKAA